MEFDCIVIGAGIVGLATARTLQQRRPDLRIAVLEKEAQVARHQSGHNSGVIHAGVYYEPGSLKARLCRAGAAATQAYCHAHDIPWRTCGKLIVATDAPELPRLATLAERARANGLACERLDAAGIAAREPAVAGLAALFVPSTGLADYPALCVRLAEQFVAAGGTLSCEQEVALIAERRDAITVETARQSWRSARLVACAGLQADRIARAAGLALDFAIVPFRGDYYALPATRRDLVRTAIYPVPDPRLPFLGIHLTPDLDGGITLGPTAMLALARERYAKWAWDGADARDLATFPGTWRVLARYPRAGLQELAHALSRRLYLRAAQRYCPALELADLGTPRCGIRAQAVTRSGELVHDFLLERTARSVHVCNAPSPAATSAFPIAETVVEHLLAGC